MLWNVHTSEVLIIMINTYIKKKQARIFDKMSENVTWVEKHQRHGDKAF